MQTEPSNTIPIQPNESQSPVVDQETSASTLSGKPELSNNSVPPPPKKNIRSPKNILIAILIIIFVIMVALLFFVISPSAGNSDNAINTPTPIPPTAVDDNFHPIATTSAYLELKSKLDNLQKTVRDLNLEDPALAPPSIELSLGFAKD